MTDVVSPEKRSRMMSGIKGKNTKPELVIRKGLFKKGFRYRLHRKDIPGKPDLVLTKYNAVIFVNGCFWHQHDCHLFKWPKQNRDFWEEKLNKNLERDIRNHDKVAQMGWRICTIWECAVKGRTTDQIELLLENISSWLIHRSYRETAFTGKMMDEGDRDL